jgi:hypothetical protein
MNLSEHVPRDSWSLYISVLWLSKGRKKERRKKKKGTVETQSHILGLRRARIPRKAEPMVSVSLLRCDGAPE